MHSFGGTRAERAQETEYGERVQAESKGNTDKMASYAGAETGVAKGGGGGGAGGSGGGAQQLILQSDSNGNQQIAGQQRGGGSG